MDKRCWSSQAKIELLNIGEIFGFMAYNTRSSFNLFAVLSFNIDDRAQTDCPSPPSPTRTMSFVYLLCLTIYAFD